VYASWLNQVEIYLSIVQHKCRTPNDFASLAAVQERLLAFERRYEQAAKPFEWKFTRDDLALLLKRLADKQHRPRQQRSGVRERGIPLAAPASRRGVGLRAVIHGGSGWCSDTVMSVESTTVSAGRPGCRRLLALRLPARCSPVSGG
jgi:hypothetical protein